MGHQCAVVAPSLIPRKPGERIKTDRRDAIKLAKLHRAGELTPVWVPDELHEAMRDLVRGAAVRSLRRARQQLSGFLLRHGHHFHRTPWTQAHRRWMADLKFDQPLHYVVLQDCIETVEAAMERRDRLEARIIAALPDKTVPDDQTQWDRSPTGERRSADQIDGKVSPYWRPFPDVAPHFHTQQPSRLVLSNRIARCRSGVIDSSALDIEELEKFNELAAAVTVFDQGMNLAGQQVDASKEAHGAMALVFVIASESRMLARHRRKIGGGVCDRLDTRLLDG